MSDSDSDSGDRIDLEPRRLFSSEVCDALFLHTSGKWWNESCDQPLVETGHSVSRR